MVRRLLITMPPLALALASGPAAAKSLFWVLSPQGPVAQTDLKLLTIDFIVIGTIVAVAIALTIIFLWRYRATNTSARYEPRWSRSPPLEIAMWGVPVVAVGVLAYFVATGSEATDPYNPGVIAAAADPKPGLDVDVIALDWRWLFVYPKQHIAAFHEIAVPVNTPVHFKLTSSTVTNSFFIPQLAGQIYVMPGMRTKLTLRADHKGTYDGFSANQSGAGFSWMRFKTRVVSKAGFHRWVARARQSSRHLSQAKFEQLAQPKIDKNPQPQYFASVAPGLFGYVIGEVKAGKVYPTPLMAGK